METWIMFQYSSDILPKYPWTYLHPSCFQWHPDCFVCKECGEPFRGGQFYEHEGFPYCETHYHGLRGSLCAGCHKPIQVNTGLWLANTDHVTTILTSDWSILITWLEYWPHNLNTGLWLVNTYHMWPEYWSLIGQYWSRDLNTGLWMLIMWSQYWPLICHVTWILPLIGHVTTILTPDWFILQGRCITAMFRKFHPECFVCRWGHPELMTFDSHDFI